MPRYVDLDNPQIIKEGRDKFGNVLYAIPPDTQTADVRPVVRGKWITTDDDDNRIAGRCSACGWEAHLYEDDVVGMNYCPNCGSGMGEE